MTKSGWVTQDMGLFSRLLSCAVILFSAAGVPAHGDERLELKKMELHECLVLGPLRERGRYVQCAVHEDTIEKQIIIGEWSPPKPRDAVRLNDGSTQNWKILSAPENRWVEDETLAGAYIYIPVDVANRSVWLLEASGHSMVYVNATPRVGHVYGFHRGGPQGKQGQFPVPVLLEAGRNELLFNCWRERFRLPSLTRPKSDAVFNALDATLPDLIVGRPVRTVAAIVVINATTRSLTDGVISVSSPLGETVRTPVPPIPAVSLRKVPFNIVSDAPSQAGACILSLELLRGGESAQETLDVVEVTLQVVALPARYTRTFISNIDGSVQYCSILPAGPLPVSAKPPGLAIVPHGAGLAARRLIQSFSPKPWCHVVAPNNRRAFGFNWEEWGRLDTLEVLDLIREELSWDPHRVYLTGHSMGGHGTWHVGATHPDRFAAIAPSAGWATIWSYGGARRFNDPTPIEQMRLRSQAPSDSISLLANCAGQGIYVLHGSADDNVPIAQARIMIDRLQDFHRDFVYHEVPDVGHWWDKSDEPGDDAVDWAPLWDFLARHRLPGNDAVRHVDFMTANPGVSSSAHWITVYSQIRQLQMSSVSIRCDPGVRRFAGTASNVRRLALDLNHFAPGEPVSVVLDGQTIADIPWPTQAPKVWLARSQDKWQVSSRPSPDGKGPHRYGPYKDAFRNRMIFVYGTKGTAEENACARNKARYGAEVFWYRGNGSVPLVADVDLDPGGYRDRGVILYGNADTNGAWDLLLADSPVQVRRGEVEVNERTVRGRDLACLFVRPRADSDVASVGVVWGTGPLGMRLTERLSNFVSGSGFPDCLIVDSEMLSKGTGAIRCAHFFGDDWTVDSGDSAWRE